MKNLLSVAVILCLFLSCTKQQSDEKTTDDMLSLQQNLGKYVVLYENTSIKKILKLANMLLR